MKTIDVATLLSQLPPYEDKWITIKKSQSVKNIIREVLDAHEEFAWYYDQIALYFDNDSVEKICEALYSFCKKNIAYSEEPSSLQTTALPTGILTRGYGDCKHFSSFCGGILDALNRLTGKNIEWFYRFASYRPFDKEPHHVFVVVVIDGVEYWIDATPDAMNATPFYQQDEKISVMPLMRNIAGVETGNQVGLTSLTVTPSSDLARTMNFNNDGAQYATMWPQYLGLSDYRDYSGDRSINENALADQLNKIIANGPDPNHTVTGEFVKWVYDNSIRSWNFLYQGGVAPGFDGTAWVSKFQNAPKLVLTPDMRVTFDHDVEVDDYRNALIHVLTAWAQDYINRYDSSPFPLKPRDVKLFSQSFTGNPNNLNANLLREWRGASFFKEVGKALEDAVNFVKEGLLKVIGIIPRNAFLALVGINAFHMATDLMNHINQGDWDKISRKWKDLGGNPDKLMNTIEHGSKQQPVDDETQTVDVPADAIGNPAALGAILAAASPIIVALLQFLNKDGKLNGVITAAHSILQENYPDVNWDFLGGALTSNGQEVQWTVDPKYNENIPPNQGGYSGHSLTDTLKDNKIIFAGGSALATYLLMKKGQRDKKIWIPLAIGGAVYLAIGLFTKQGGSSPDSKRSYLMNWVRNIKGEDEAVQHYLQVFQQMTDSEINIVYEWIYNYVKPGIPLPEEGALYNEMVVLDNRYQLFGT